MQRVPTQARKTLKCQLVFELRAAQYALHAKRRSVSRTSDLRQFFRVQPLMRKFRYSPSYHWTQSDNGVGSRAAHCVSLWAGRILASDAVVDIAHLHPNAPVGSRRQGTCFPRSLYAPCPTPTTFRTSVLGRSNKGFADYDELKLHPQERFARRNNRNALYRPQREQVRLVASDQQHCPSVHRGVQEHIVIWVGTHSYPRLQLDPLRLVNKISGDVRDECVGDFPEFPDAGIVEHAQVLFHNRI